MAARGLNAQGTGARVASEQVANVGVDPGLVRERLSRNKSKPIVNQPRAELTAGVAGRKLEVQADSHCRKTRATELLVKVPLHPQVCIACASLRLSSQDAKDREI